MIRAVNLSFSYREKPIFIKANFMIGSDQKVGLVGPNGAGKSTLFNLISQKEQPEDGSIQVQGMVELVPQEVKRDPILENSRSVRDYIDCGHQTEEYELRKILDGLEMPAISLNSKPQNLSGGQKTKLAIARALLLEPDILLLDEPTNFLDIAGKKWVMEFLSNYPHTVLIVSHDLELLNHAIDKVIAINTFNHEIEEYSGNYTTFVKLKKEREELLKRQVRNEQKHIQRMKEGLSKMARLTSQKGVRQKTRLRHRIEKMEENLPDLPQEIKRIHISLPQPAHVGSLPLMLTNISKSYGDLHVLRDVSLAIKRGERVALIGPNGAGKSTFIKVALGLLEPDYGTVNPDEHLSIGYYCQEFETLDMSMTLLDTIEEKASLSIGAARGVLAKFMFSGPKVFQRVETLSGGEKTRLSIALLLLYHHNLLVLDEPTTYLDVISQRVILEALKKYQGAMLVVSHTPEFLLELEPARALFLPQNKLSIWEPVMAEMASEV